MLLKGGSTDGGAQAAASHTGALAADDKVFDGACKAYGITRAATVEQAYEAAATFATQPLPSGPQVVVLTTAGGWGVVTADAITRDPDLELLELPDDLKAAIDEHLPARWSRNNPVDCAGGETRDTIPTVMSLIANHADVDAIIYIGLGIQSNQARLMREGRFYPGHGLERIVEYHERQDTRFAETAAASERVHRQADPHRNRTGTRRPRQCRARCGTCQRSPVLPVWRSRRDQRSATSTATHDTAIDGREPRSHHASRTGSIRRATVGPPRTSSQRSGADGRLGCCGARPSAAVVVVVSLGEMIRRPSPMMRFLHRLSTVAPPTDVPPALSTGLLSIRRTASMLSNDLNLDAFQGAVAPLLDMLNGQSCAMVTLDGQLVGARNEMVPVIPASNQKVLVAAVALDVLGPDFVFTTNLVGPAPSGGVIAGDVFLVGGGDALLSGEWYEAAALDTNPAFNTTPIDDLARQLVAAGVTEIRGVVRGDGSRYDDEWYVSTWGEGVAGLEAGPYDALLVNDAGCKATSSAVAILARPELVNSFESWARTASPCRAAQAVGTAPAGETALGDGELATAASSAGRDAHEQRQQHCRVDGQGDWTCRERHRHPPSRSRRDGCQHQRLGCRHDRAGACRWERAQPRQSCHLYHAGRSAGTRRRRQRRRWRTRGRRRDRDARVGVHRDANGWAAAGQDRHAEQLSHRRRSPSSQDAGWLPSGRWRGRDRVRVTPQRPDDF